MEACTLFARKKVSRFFRIELQDELAPRLDRMLPMLLHPGADSCAIVSPSVWEGSVQGWIIPVLEGLCVCRSLFPPITAAK